jgi:hypothetical protein
MAARLEIDQATVTDNDVARQVEFTAEIDGDERDFAVDYAVLKALSGDEPEDDALEIFERFGDEIAEICADAAEQRPSASVITIDEGDLE